MICPACYQLPLQTSNSLILPDQLKSHFLILPLELVCKLHQHLLLFFLGKRECLPELIGSGEFGRLSLPHEVCPPVLEAGIHVALVAVSPHVGCSTIFTNELRCNAVGAPMSAHGGQHLAPPNAAFVRTEEESILPLNPPLSLSFRSCHLKSKYFNLLCGHNILFKHIYKNIVQLELS